MGVAATAELVGSLGGWAVECLSQRLDGIVGAGAEQGAQLLSGGAAGPQSRDVKRAAARMQGEDEAVAVCGGAAWA